MKAKPTRTTNELHFTDLSARRFEDLCLALVYPLHPWADIQHYGRSGSDKGVDIHALESMEDRATRLWSIQCKRYEKAPKATLVAAVDDALKHTDVTPAVLLVIVACDVSRSAHEAFRTHAIAVGINTPQLWTASILEAMLRGRRPDLLFSYFGISEVQESRERELRVSRNIELKKRLNRDLRADPQTVDWERQGRVNPSGNSRA